MNRITSWTSHWNPSSDTSRSFQEHSRPIDIKPCWRRPRPRLRVPWSATSRERNRPRIRASLTRTCIWLRIGSCVSNWSPKGIMLGHFGMSRQPGQRPMSRIRFQNWSVNVVVGWTARSLSLCSRFSTLERSTRVTMLTGGKSRSKVTSRVYFFGGGGLRIMSVDETNSASFLLHLGNFFFTFSSFTTFWVSFSVGSPS